MERPRQKELAVATRYPLGHADQWYDTNTQGYITGKFCVWCGGAKNNKYEIL